MSSDFSVQSSELVEAGELVALGEDGGVRRSQTGYDQLVMGVAIESQKSPASPRRSRGRAKVKSQKLEEEEVATVEVVSSGKAEVLIDSDSPEIRPGDFITSSGSYPGKGSKATEAGFVIGRA